MSIEYKGYRIFTNMRTAKLGVYIISKWIREEYIILNQPYFYKYVNDEEELISIAKTIIDTQKKYLKSILAEKILNKLL